MMNRTIDKRLSALEDQLLRPAIDTKTSLDGFDIDKYQRLMLELTSKDGWLEGLLTAFHGWEGVKQKINLEADNESN